MKGQRKPEISLYGFCAEKKEDPKLLLKSKGCKSSWEVKLQKKTRSFIAGLLGFSGVARDISAKLPILMGLACPAIRDRLDIYSVLTNTFYKSASIYVLYPPFTRLGGGVGGFEGNKNKKKRRKKKLQVGHHGFQRAFLVEVFAPPMRALSCLSTSLS